MAVVVLAAGKGRRMRSEIPKVLHRICGQTLLERTLRAVAAAGAQRVVVVVGYGRELVIAELNRLAALEEFSSVDLSPVYQAEQKGTGHAAQVGLSEIGDFSSVAIVPGDTPLLDGDVLREFVSQSSEEAVVTVLSCTHPCPAGFGRIIRDAQGAVTAIIEDKDCSEEQLTVNEINTSFYLASSEFLAEALAQLRADNAQGELYLTDIVSFAVSQGSPVEAVCAADFLRVSGANTRAELGALEAKRRAQINWTWMEAGVTLEDPATTYIDETVKIGSDCWIGAGTRLKGQTTLGQSVVVEGNSQIVDSNIGSNSTIRFSSYVTEAVLGENCQIGPFVQLRPQAVLHDDVKLGNFVEVKKSELHQGVKANHLAYIGDAVIGASSNVGAGTIFCNYDGTKKSTSTLAEGVFVGSNSTLVSPVTIGKEAYIAAGSVITKDVPSGALGIGRTRQSNKDDWASRRKKSKQ